MSRITFKIWFIVPQSSFDIRLRNMICLCCSEHVPFILRSAKMNQISSWNWGRSRSWGREGSKTGILWTLWMTPGSLLSTSFFDASMFLLKSLYCTDYSHLLQFSKVSKDNSKEECRRKKKSRKTKSLRPFKAVRTPEIFNKTLKQDLLK